MEKTLSIIKPDATNRDLIGKILAKFESVGLRIAGLKMVRFSNDLAGKFYEVHKERPFYGELVDSMTSRQVVVIALEGENAVKKCRDIMGATNPKDAAPGTIRQEFALSIGENSVHGSDSIENAKIELGLLFEDSELFFSK